MIRVVIESPLAGDFVRNRRYALLAMRDSLLRGEAPFASHLLYTQVFDNKNPTQKTQGIEAGLAWGGVAELAAVYVDLGISEGMKRGEARHKANGLRIEYRTIDDLERRLAVLKSQATKGFT